MAKNDKTSESDYGVTHYEPSRSISPMREIMEQFFNDDFFAKKRESSLLGKEFSREVLFPKINISENDREVVVTANVPGMSADQIHIDVDEDVLTISGKVEKEERVGKEGESYYRYEREFGEFRRDIVLPTRVMSDGVVAKAKNGVLTVILPKAEISNKKSITVKEE